MAAFVKYVSSFSDMSLQINLVFLRYSLCLPIQIYSEILLKNLNTKLTHSAIQSGEKKGKPRVSVTFTAVQVSVTFTAVHFIKIKSIRLISVYFFNSKTSKISNRLPIS